MRCFSLRFFLHLSNADGAKIKMPSCLTLKLREEHKARKAQENSTPTSSQSHFSSFDNFVPDDRTPFQDEFTRLASSHVTRA
ncbi:hypothetical protein QBC38DRAFT_474107 [Podospora fimiseda]|uniref:Uncharacterized protein n=1 Tax=Podospora fimiseda TaxID=252190 RepID=A0AAN7H5X6_9PEZI|nr:hypothetical protein QBC38DRAFT_474107 [Podospora fimiseda]